jgi:predicted Zn-dependent protease with MMP-like domain
MSDEEFMKLVEEGVASLRPDIQKAMKNVAIVVRDIPSKRQRIENDLSDDEDLFGLYEGVPLTERGVSDDILLPDRITIFKEAILRAYTTHEEITACVQNTVWHEVAHHFGMDEEQVALEEIRRGKTI